MNHAKVVLDEDDVRRTLVRIAHEIVEKNAGQPVALVGIHRRGAHLATRLHRLVCDLLDEEVPLGDIDIAFYRDDVATRPVEILDRQQVPHARASSSSTMATWSMPSSSVTRTLTRSPRAVGRFLPT